MEDSYEVDFEDTREDISLLLHGIDRYNPENLHQLESYVHQQTSENQYDLDANLAVLKLYQFNPQLHQTNVVIQILLKALMNLPRTDFYLCKCLIDENHTHDKSIEKVLYLSDLMETCHFKDFWHEVRNECQDLVEGIKGFEEAVMSYISGVLAITYQSIDAQLLSDLLGGLEGNDLQEWIKLRNWSFMDGWQKFSSVIKSTSNQKILLKRLTFILLRESCKCRDEKLSDYLLIDVIRPAL